MGIEEDKQREPSLLRWALAILVSGSLNSLPLLAIDAIAPDFLAVSYLVASSLIIGIVAAARYKPYYALVNWEGQVMGKIAGTCFAAFFVAIAYGVTGSLELASPAETAIWIAAAALSLFYIVCGAAVDHRAASEDLWDRWEDRW